jgi:hypothetical protein
LKILQGFNAENKQNNNYTTAKKRGEVGIKFRKKKRAALFRSVVRPNFASKSEIKTNILLFDKTEHKEKGNFVTYVCFFMMGQMSE